MGADKIPGVSAAKASESVVAAAKKDSIAALSDGLIEFTTPFGAPKAPRQDVVDSIEMSYVAVNVAALAAFLAADTTGGFSFDTPDVLLTQPRMAASFIFISSCLLGRPLESSDL